MATLLSFSNTSLHFMAGKYTLLRSNDLGGGYSFKFHLLVNYELFLFTLNGSFSPWISCNGFNKTERLTVSE